MSIQVTLDGAGAFAGAAANVNGYTVTEDATSLSLANIQGGVGGIDFSVIEDPGPDGSILLPGESFTLLDPNAGSVAGIIDSGSTTDETQLNITGATRLLPLVAERVVPAYSGSLQIAILNYLAQVGITTGIQIDPSFLNIHVDLPSFQGEVWQQLKKLAAVHQFEIATVAGSIIIRKPRQRWVDVRRYSSTRLNFGNAQASRTVEVHYYNNEWKNNVQVFPDPESSIVDRSIISVNAGETSTTNLDVKMWISTIDEPTHVGFLPWDNTSTTSVYAVVDKDGTMVSPEDWRNGGGEVKFAPGADGKSIDVTVRGMITNARAPYRIASSSVDKEYQYPALYIAATGVAFEDKVISSGTGANPAGLPVDSVYVIDDPIVSTLAEAQLVLSRALIDQSGLAQSFEASSTAINRRGEIGEIVYPTFEWFKTEYAGMTFADFNTMWAGKTFADFNESVADVVRDDFANQAFGGIGGARVRYRDSIYRIDSATATPGQFTWTATPDTLFSEFNEAYAGKTFAQFSAIWAGKTFEDFARQPLHV